MEFWGVEVKAGEKLVVQPEFRQLIHISQAAVGELKDVKGAKSIPLRLKIDNKNFIIGNLSTEDRTQVMFDLVFEREFELSHDWKHGSVFFIGYVADDHASEGSDFSDSDESEDEDEPVEAQENGIAKAKAGLAKAAVAVAVAKKGAEGKGKKVEEPESDDDDSESDDEMALDGLAQADSDDVSDDDSEEDDESEEELPKAQQSKKRQAESAEKTPVAKKAKAATPDKSGKKGQNATPATSKSAGKTPDKLKVQSPKSGGQHTCKSCPKTFTSEAAMQSHAKAKHGGK